MSSAAKDSRSLGILLVDHGSRVTQANEALETLAHSIRDSGRYGAVRHAHMELAPPSIADAFSSLAGDGVSRVIVIPYFLALGRHAAEDIPALCEKAAEQHPQLAWQLGDPVGTSASMADVVTERINAALSRD